MKLFAIIVGIFQLSVVASYQSEEPPPILLETEGAKQPLEGDFTPKPDSYDIEALIRLKSQKWGVDENLALAVAKAESNFNPLAKNPNSSASGVYQFINSTWRENCKGNVFDPEANIDCALRMISEGGLHHWRASEFTWRKINEN